MLTRNQSIAYLSPKNILIWVILAFQAGLLNIGGFMAGHRVVSHVTGFATLLGYEVSHNETINILGMLIIPIFFLAGAMISGYFVDIKIKLDRLPHYYIIFGFIFILIVIVLTMGLTGEFGLFGHGSTNLKNHILLILLSLACGIQNGTVATVSNSVIRTTHLTGITTDLGIGLIRFLNRKKIKGKMKDEGQLNMVRAFLIIFFTFGSVIGAFIFKRWGFLGFILPALISGTLFLIMFYFQVCMKLEANN